MHLLAPYINERAGASYDADVVAVGFYKISSGIPAIDLQSVLVGVEVA
jgi:hypothetical protein